MSKNSQEDLCDVKIDSPSFDQILQTELIIKEEVLESDDPLGDTSNSTPRPAHLPESIDVKPPIEIFDKTLQENLKRKVFYSDERFYKCTICDKLYQKTYILPLNKEIKVEEDKNSNICDICDKKQQDPSTAEKKVNPEERPYVCTTCNKSFILSHHLTRHKRVHTGEKPYTCTICNKSFTQTHNLTRHEKLHTGEKPYGCDICEKRFTQMSTLITHQRLHTGEKPYSCNVCNKKFTQTSALTTHQRVHTGERPYTCSICNKSFAQMYGLTQHERVHTYW